MHYKEIPFPHCITKVYRIAFGFNFRFQLENDSEMTYSMNLPW